MTEAFIPGFGWFPVEWVGGLLDDNDKDCGSWCATDESRTPPSWSDGICWTVNEAGKPSVKPTRWRQS